MTAVVMLVFGCVIAIPQGRGALLRAAGRALVAEDPKQPVDIIVITVDADGAGVLEASDLVREGVSRRVAIFADPPDAVDLEFVRRGVSYVDSAAVERRLLGALGVAEVTQIPRGVSGTEDEALVLPAWCDQNGLHSVELISTRDHSRRVRRVMRRAMEGHATRVFVRYSRYSSFDPDAWWSTRDGERTEIIELGKLMIEILRHPLQGS